MISNCGGFFSSFIIRIRVNPFVQQLIRQEIMIVLVHSFMHWLERIREQALIQNIGSDNQNEGMNNRSWPMPIIKSLFMTEYSACSTRHLAEILAHPGFHYHQTARR